MLERFGVTRDVDALSLQIQYVCSHVLPITDPVHRKPVATSNGCPDPGGNLVACHVPWERAIVVIPPTTSQTGNPRHSSLSDSTADERHTQGVWDGGNFHTPCFQPLGSKETCISQGLVA